jgi:uncharacterized membrane protein
MIENFLNWLIKPNVLATVKTVTYKIVSGTTTFIIVYVWTGDAKGSGGATLVMMGVHMLQYWIHERAWLAWENKQNTQKETA